MIPKSLVSAAATAAVLATTLAALSCVVPTVGIPPELAAMKESKYADVDGVRLHYYDFNPESNDKTIVHIHGYAGAGIEIMPVARLLKDARLIAVDLPGSGFSERPSVPLTIAYFASIVDRFIEYLGIGDFYLSGHSMGCNVAVAYLAEYGNAKVLKAIFISPDGMKDEEGAFLVSIGKKKGWLDFGMSFNTPAMYDFLARVNVFYDIKQFTEPVRTIARAGVFYDGGIEALKNATMNAIGSYPVDGLLASVTTPVLLFWGRNDKVLKFSWSEKYLALLPNVEFHALDECGHVPQIEKAAEVAPIIEDFIGR